MAKEKVKQEVKPEEEGEEAPKKKKGGLLKILILVIVLGVGGGGAAWYFMQPGAAKKGAPAQAKHDEMPPIYERLEQFTVNLSGGEHYLQLEVNLKVADAKVSEKIKLFLPEIRAAVVNLLRKKSVEDMSPPNDSKLPEEVKAEVNKVLKAQTPEEGVTMVLFPSLVVQ